MDSRKQEGFARTFLHDDQYRQKRCSEIFDVTKMIEAVFNLELNYLANQLNGEDRDEKILRHSLIRQMIINEEKVKKKMKTN